MVASTHLKAKFGDLRASFRHEQSKDILKWLEAIRGGRPIILAGDLNGLPSESFFSTLTSDRDVPLVSSYGVREEEDMVMDYTTWKVRETGEQVILASHWLILSIPASHWSILFTEAHPGLHPPHAGPAGDPEDTQCP